MNKVLADFKSCFLIKVISNNIYFIVYLYRAEARRIFELFDADQDGLLDEPELRQLAAHLGTP